MQHPRAPAVPPLPAIVVEPGGFVAERHFYPAALAAALHPVARDFLALDAGAIALRHARRHPDVDRGALARLFAHRPRWFAWAGADLFFVEEDGRRGPLLIEVNSCPAGLKSMPAAPGDGPHRAYRGLVERCFLPRLDDPGLPAGELAVIHDKNPMEASGYAATIADLTGRPVLLARAGRGAPPRFVDGVLHLRGPGGDWLPVQAALRYVTDEPWLVLPPHTRTAILNPVLACLAGGRHKRMAARAYAALDAELAGSGLAIRTPATWPDVAREALPAIVERLGGHAVVKRPCSNAGQGVFTITGGHELGRCLERLAPGERCVVQELVGHRGWRTGGPAHQPIVLAGAPFVADLRMIVAGGADGLRPIALYARRARGPLTEALPAARPSWEMLGTNLSVRRADGGWDTDADRLLLADQATFPALGLDLDDLVDALVQAVLATVAVDRMAARLAGMAG